MTDVIIVGGGIAAVSAALTLNANGKDFLMLAKEVGGKAQKAEKIKNYPALFPLTGKELKKKLAEHLQKEKITPLSERVSGVYKTKDGFTVLTESGKSFESRAVILCVGVSAVGEIDGEAEFLGRGVSYCATCDGALYKGKTIAVVATNKEYEPEAEFLAGLAKKTYFLPLYQGGKAIGETVADRPVCVRGDRRVNALICKERTLDVDGVFFLKESIPPSSLVGGLETDGKHIAVDGNCATNLDGLFAAGDCTGRPYQFAVAAGEGTKAAFSAVAWLAKSRANDA